MGYQALRIPDELHCAREQFALFDDFNSYNDADLWTKLSSDTNSAVAHEGPGRSRLKLITGDSVLNNECCVATTNELFKFVGNKALIGEGLIQYAEVATDDAKVAFGFADAIGANTITDAGAVAAVDAMLLWKTTDGTKWIFHTEINGTSTATTSATTAGGTSAQTLRIEAIPRSATEFECRPFVDGAQLKDANGNPIMHVVTLGTATDMDFGVYVKSGSGTSGIETVYVDYLYAAQVR